MQEIESTSTPMKNDFDSQIEAAKARLAKLSDAASDADAETSRWQIAFEREPTAQAHSEHAIATQKARNAHALVAEGKTELARLESERSKQATDAVRAQLQAEQEAAEQRLTAAFEALAAAQVQIAAAVAAFGECARHRVQAGMPGGRLTPLATRLASRIGGAEFKHYDYTFGNDPRFEFTLRYPLRGVVPTEAQ